MAGQKNPNQIVRKDGSDCFVEVMSTAFGIGKVQFNFISYNKSNAPRSRVTAHVEIYFSFEEFYRICHDLTVSCSILKNLLKNANDAKAAGRKYPTPITLYIGGKSAESLSASGNARPDGKSLSRQLKIFSGNKYPVILQAESGAGEQNEKGLIVPRYQTPENKIMIPLSYESMKELFLVTKAHLDAYISAQYTYKLFHPEDSEQSKTTPRISNVLDNESRSYNKEDNYSVSAYSSNKESALPPPIPPLPPMDDNYSDYAPDEYFEPEPENPPAQKVDYQYQQHSNSYSGPTYGNDIVFPSAEDIAFYE